MSLVAVGCGYKPKLPAMAEASGTVTLDGQPLPRAMIQFVPDSQKGTQGPTGVAAADDLGHFEVTTAGVKGAPVGHHKISVHARKAPKDTTDTMPPSLIPAHYNDPSTSELTAEVNKDQKNVVDLRLRSRP